jgi:hypothetical protein
MLIRGIFNDGMDLRRNETSCRIKDGFLGVM